MALHAFERRDQLARPRLRADERLKSTPVLMISCGGREERARARQTGVDAYLEKPVRFADVTGTIACLRHVKQGGAAGAVV